MQEPTCTAGNFLYVPAVVEVNDFFSKNWSSGTNLTIEGAVAATRITQRERDGNKTGGSKA